MKGTFFQKPLELSLKVEGESWRQGDSIRGVLSVRSHAAEPLVPGAKMKVSLALGELKKVRQKAPDAFTAVATMEAELPKALEAQSEITFPWTFKLDSNAPITDASASLFLIYGSAAESEKMGQLQLLVHPAPPVQEFLNILQTRFRFVLKAQKYVKGGVEAKFDPPSAKQFAVLDQMVVSFCFKEETLEARYLFQVKRLEATAASFEVKKDKKSEFQKFSKEQYLLPSGRFDDEKIEAAIREAISVVDPKTLISA